MKIVNEIVFEKEEAEILSRALEIIEKIEDDLCKPASAVFEFLYMEVPSSTPGGYEVPEIMSLKNFEEYIY